ncbi:MAG: AbrB/MazE/SpoVT family DNA-binding domain-containing protein [Actinobacteria bacterium]|nr:AbrB/MazE/SpoVT family DNA-binding domain-containing protein [Actinomycetota bacterium]MBU4240608.1 AbrB/MazE/SpoVT family DNA-binding domain-containing protein [Actinomycetota bacterium]MBU4302145.1 AbrB/MazE/SpoVT family DNA-binding domain-containing protein [Actinomycetota bacterium]MBU4489991.1 AbrB/MazE/SpoVT family DNA-binding domain-containing protein [Actinomycetota bacterium]MCG2794974.1 AbrB/MazE/SpoVT family DNA-binding domain-containing protein [Actinomycetes bacterium]
MEVAKVSTRYQIVIPREARRLLGIKEGDELLVGAKEGVIEMIKRPESYAEFTRGLGSYVWEDVDVDQYVRGERESWEQSET